MNYKKRNEEIANLYLKTGMSLEDVAKRYGITKQRVSMLFKEMGVVTRKEKGKRKNLNTLFTRTQSEQFSEIVNTANTVIKDYQQRLRREQIRNAMARKYYTKMMAKYRLESAELMEVLDGKI